MEKVRQFRKRAEEGGIRWSLFTLFLLLLAFYASTLVRGDEIPVTPLTVIPPGEHVLGPIPDDTGFTLAGAGSGLSRVATGPIRASRRVVIRGLTFVDTRIELTDTHEATLEDCVFVNTPVVLRGTWDGDVRDCQFVGFKNQTCLTVVGSERQTNCLTVDNCRFENNENLHNIYVGTNARKIRLHNCKSHGPDTGTHLYLENCAAISLTNCNFTRKGVGVYGKNVRDLWMDGCWLDGGLRVGLFIETPIQWRQTIRANNIYPRDQPNEVNEIIR